MRLAVQLTGWRIDIKSESKMRELAQWLAEAVSVVEGCGEADAELLLQQGLTSLEDLADSPADLLTSIPGIDEAGEQRIKQKAAELAVRKREEEEERARLEAERLVEEAAAAEAAAAAAAAAAESGAPGGEEAGAAPAAATGDETGDETDGGAGGAAPETQTPGETRS